MRVLAHLYASRDDGRNGRDYHVLNEPDFDKREIVNKEREKSCGCSENHKLPRVDCGSM